MAVEIVAEEKRQMVEAGAKLTELQKKLLMAALEVTAEKEDGVALYTEIMDRSGVSKGSIYYALRRLIVLEFLQETVVVRRGAGRAVRCLVDADFVAGIMTARAQQVAKITREESRFFVTEKNRQAARDAYAGRRYEDDPAASRERVHGYVPGRAYNRSLTGNGMENA